MDGSKGAIAAVNRNEMTLSSENQRSVEASEQLRWPFLERLASKGIVSRLDLEVAKEILSGRPNREEWLAALACYLSQAFCDGHVCVHMTPERLKPDLEELWKRISATRKGKGDLEVSREELAEFCRLVRKGIHSLGEAALDHSIVSWSTSHEVLVYLQSQWHAETRWLEEWNRLTKAKPSLGVEERSLQRRVESLIEKKVLLPEQGAAVLSCSTNSVVLLSGGPGTGKTYTAGWLIGTLWEALNSEQKKTFEMALAAPTGKAAANLQTNLAKSCSEMTPMKLKASTLHSLLDLRPSGGGKRPLLSADLVVVDECSMVDLSLMTRLLGAVKTGARLVLLGDAFQLPPVEAGACFSELMCLDEGSERVERTRLSTCVRTDRSDLLDLAVAVREGKWVDFCNVLSSQKTSVGRLSWPFFPLHELGNRLAEWVGKRLGEAKDPEEALWKLQQFRLLCPLRRGPLGVDRLNEMLAERLGEGRSQRILPLLVTLNDKRLGLSNGDVGVVVQQRRELVRDPLCFREGDYAYFFANDGSGRVRRLPAILLRKVALAYALSVHKSQGSEFEEVLLLMPEGAEVFGRELFYTAVTRAKRSLEIVGTDETLRQALSRPATRVSGLAFRLTV